MRTPLSVVLAIAACGNDHGKPNNNGTPDAGTPPGSTVVYLTPIQHLSRASLALRGVRPSLQDLQDVSADPSQLSAKVDGYLETPEFGAMIMDLHNEALLLRIEYPLYVPNVGTLPDGTTFTDMAGSFNEPLQLIRDVVMTDQPYSNIVTVPYTMANTIVAGMWEVTPLTPPTDTTTWTRATWNDGRPAAGILSTSILWQRWMSAGFNYDRGRANMVSRALLCHDFLQSDIAVDTSVDLSDPEAVAKAVQTNPSCAGCHQTLDPLASYFFANADAQQTFNSWPASTYNAKNVNRWMTTNDRPPGYFGQAPAGVDGLGQAIAADPRFRQCAAINFATFMTQVSRDQLPDAWIADLQSQFEQSNLSAKALAKAIVLSDQFRVAYDTDPTKADNAVGYLKIRPEQMSRMLYDLTGFLWTTTSSAKTPDVVGLTNLLTSDYIGFRALGGGIDSYFVTSPVLTMNATSTLTAKFAAAAAADFVLQHDATAAQADRTLMTQADVTSTDEPTVRAELAYLHARIYGELVATDDPSITTTYTMLFQPALAQSSDPQRAWTVTLIGMLTDVRSLYY